MRPTTGADTVKAAMAGALKALAEITLQGVAQRMGVAPTTVYGYANAERRLQPSRDRARQLAAILRADAQRLLAAADTLELAADDNRFPAG